VLSSATRADVPLLLLLSTIVATAMGRLALSQRGKSAAHEQASSAGVDELTGVDGPTADSSDGSCESSGSLETAYEMGEVIGHGHFATVHRGRHRASGEEVAIKHIAMSSDSSAIRHEIEIMRRIGSHRNIVGLRDVFETEDGWYLVLELVTGGELFERLVQKGAYSEKEASALFRQIGEAIAYLHKQDFCHRDLKPENLLLSTQEEVDDAATVKICDFGLSVALEDGATLRDRQGTWAYWAPEMFAKSGYGKEVDIWSLGVILYIILSGRHPFDAPGRSDAQMRAFIQEGKFAFEHEAWASISAEAKQLISALLQHDPKRRIDAETLLRHPWIVGTHVSEAPLASTNLQEYQQMRKKWSAALVASMHRTKSMRKRYSDLGLAEQVGNAADESALFADAFHVFDPQGKGFVLASDLEGVIARLGQRVTPDELAQMISALDGGKTGKIHYQEYLNMASATVMQQKRAFSAGEVIFREGEASDYFYLITSGRVRKLTKPPHGYAHSQWVAAEEELSVGDYFGTSAILGSGCRHSTMVAVTDVQVVALARDDFEFEGPPPRRRLSERRGGRFSPERSLRFINMMTNNEPRIFGAGEVLFRQGEEGDTMFILKSGRVQVSLVSSDGRKHIVGERGTGECCGETACLSANPRNCTIACVSDEGCETLCVSRADFLELVRGSWDVRHDLIALSERHSREKERRVNFMRTRDEVCGGFDDEDVLA